MTRPCSSSTASDRRRGRLDIALPVLAALSIAGLTVTGTAAGAPFRLPSWSIQATPNPGPFSQLEAVSCRSASACTAVGESNSTGHALSLAERWNGKKWVIQPTPHPMGATTGSTLRGVACPSLSDCTAVGSRGSAPTALAERWEGARWTIQSTPLVSGTTSMFLAAVSCTAATACTAVGGDRDTAGAYLALAEHWNGTSWKAQKMAEPGGVDSTLSAVSCTSITSCTAVGDWDTSSGKQEALVEQWDGNKWTIKSTPDVSGATNNLLLGLSCHSGSACIATGYFIDARSHQLALAEHWNGTTWSLVLPPALENGSLSSASCVSAADCTAAGSYSRTGGISTLVETWNGSKWTRVSSPNAAGAVGDNLLGVSCPSASSCEAAGWKAPAGSGNLTLALGYS